MFPYIEGFRHGEHQLAKCFELRSGTVRSTKGELINGECSLRRRLAG